MPRNATAQATQIARIIAHAGAANASTGRLTWSPAGDLAAVAFDAMVEAANPERDGYDANTGDDTMVRVTAARGCFTVRLPCQGEVFRDDAQRLYRVQKILSHPLHPTAAFLCGSVA